MISTTIDVTTSYIIKYVRLGKFSSPSNESFSVTQKNMSLQSSKSKTQ